MSTTSQVNHNFSNFVGVGSDSRVSSYIIILFGKSLWERPSERFDLTDIYLDRT